jgi:hypothetical protein
METTTETNQANRELTTTEIQIAIAQIKDRLMRVAKAQSELGGIAEEDDEKEFAAKLRAKYDIPELVYLFAADCSGLGKDDVKNCMPHIASFVKGKLTEDGISDLIFFFEELAECDYGWILAERPMGFYNDQTTADHMDDVRWEIESIGTRSRSKNTKLPQIAGFCSADFGR